MSNLTPVFGKNMLPYDYWRCTSEECPKRNDCIRAVSMNFLGPRTPVMDAYSLSEICGNYQQVEAEYLPPPTNA